jgi:cation diffusion facilitator CzcD-associated flavoprotein CzcO
MELDVWTSSTVKSARKNADGTWDVIVERDGKERTFKPKHLVFATGIGANEGRFPSIPGMVRRSFPMLHYT